ncbi:hypothetical protein OEZ86_011266 [Tetradesmus obliquus]|nr:hypothetical protein OEZ86_011266 [Tetradesmus obliquus]
MRHMRMLHQQHGITELVTGDILDVAGRFMQRAVKGTGVTLVTPLWQLPRSKVLAALHALGIDSMISCINVSKYGAATTAVLGLLRIEPEARAATGGTIGEAAAAAAAGGWDAVVLLLGQRVTPELVAGPLAEAQQLFGADLGGELGEYHTLVLRAPLFSQPVELAILEVVRSVSITVLLIVAGCSHAVTASVDAVRGLEPSTSSAATTNTPSSAARIQAAAAARQAAPIAQQVLRQPLVQQQVVRQPAAQQQLLRQPGAVIQQPSAALQGAAAAVQHPLMRPVAAARGAAGQPVLVPARQQVVVQQPARQQQQHQQQPVLVQQPARQQQQQTVLQQPVAAARPVVQQPGRQQQIIVQQPVAAVRPGQLPGQIITAPVAMQPVAAARPVPVQQPRIVYVPVPVPVAAEPVAAPAHTAPKRPERSSGGLGGLGDLDFGLLPKLNLTSGLESFRSGLSGLLTDFQKNGGFWNAASRSENIANAVQLGVKGGLNLVAPIVNGIASSVPIMVPSLNGQCLQGKAVRPLKSNRKLIMCLIYIEDAKTGNSTRYRVLVGKDDTAGEYFTVEVLIRPTAYGLVKGKPGSDAAHYHSQQQERVRVKAGKLGYYIGHHSHVQAAEAGEEVLIKPGEAHALFNAGGGSNGSELLLEVTHSPARHGEALYETLAGLGYDYESPLAVSPLQKWLTLGYAEVVPTDIPPATWNFIQSWLLPFAQKIGYKPFYPQYKTKREYSGRDGQAEQQSWRSRSGKDEDDDIDDVELDMDKYEL